MNVTHGIIGNRENQVKDPLMIKKALMAINIKFWALVTLGKDSISGMNKEADNACRRTYYCQDCRQIHKGIIPQALTK